MPTTPPNVLVTGAGRGIGRAIALRFAREGWRVVVAARTRREIEAVADEVRAAGGAGLAIVMDVADMTSVDSGVHAALPFCGGVIDVLVNNAGVFMIEPFEQLSPETWQHHVAVNLNGPFHVARACLPALVQSTRGHVFNISSVAGRQAFPGNTAYCATKYGLRGFSDALRLDLQERDIRVSTVYPGATDTSIFDGVPGVWDRSTMKQPEDVAELVWTAYTRRDDTVDDIDV